MSRSCGRSAVRSSSGAQLLRLLTLLAVTPTLMTRASSQRSSSSTTWSFLLISSQRSETERFMSSTCCPYKRSESTSAAEAGPQGHLVCFTVTSPLHFRSRSWSPPMTSSPTRQWWCWTSWSDIPSWSRTQVWWCQMFPAMVGVSVS